MKKVIPTIALGLMPLVTFAAPPIDYSCSSVSPKESIGSMFNWASCTLINSVVPLLFSLAVVGFIWGVIQYFLFPDNEEKRKKGKSYMIWGLIALFVMISMWGLVGVLTKTFGIQTLIPQLSQ